METLELHRPVVDSNCFICNIWNLKFEICNFVIIVINFVNHLLIIHWLLWKAVKRHSKPTWSLLLKRKSSETAINILKFKQLHYLLTSIYFCLSSFFVYVASFILVIAFPFYIIHLKLHQALCKILVNLSRLQVAPFTFFLHTIWTSVFQFAFWSNFRAMRNTLEKIIYH